MAGSKPERYIPMLLSPRSWWMAMAILLLSFAVQAQDQDPNTSALPPEARVTTEPAAEGNTMGESAGQAATEPQEPVQMSRPFNAFERFSYESGISNQLQSLMGRYINPALFHISVQVEGRMVNNAGAGAIGSETVSGQATGKPVETFGEDKTLEMLPALPFFSSRLRAPVRVEEAETSTQGTGKQQRAVPVEAPGPHIDRIRVYFMTDTMIKAESNSFYRNLISSALRLDPGRGDDIVMSTTAFPKQAAEASAGQAAMPPISVNATLSQPPAQAEADNRMAEVVSSMGNELALLIGAGLALIGILIFVGLVWHARKSSESAAAAVAATKSSNSSRSAGAGDGGSPENPYAAAAPPQMARMQIQAEMASHDPQQAQLKESDPLMDWLINDRENLAFTLERWIRDQGKRVIDKMVLMLYPYGNHFFDMLTEYLEPDTVAQAQVVWNGWDPDNHDTASRQRALDELSMSMKNQKQFGNFPFIIYLKDKEILALLEDEPALNCLMVLDGLAANRKSAIMDMFDAEKTTEMLSSYAELNKQKYGRYADLSSRLFLKLKEIRERGEQNEKAYESVLGTIMQQSMRKQEEMLENLRESNPKMYDWIRERITLWSDVANLADNVLAQALESMESDAIASLLAGDQVMQDRMLPLRPQREQVLIKNLLSQNGLSTQRTEDERKAFLARLPQGEEAEALAESKEG